MTTKITVDAHAGWDILVELETGERNSQKNISHQIVKAGDVVDFYIHSGMSIRRITEMSKQQYGYKRQQTNV